MIESQRHLGASFVLLNETFFDYAYAMSRKRFSHMNCAAAQALEQIGDWWTLLIVREAFYGAQTFTEFQDRLGIARNILSDRLTVLVENGILARERVRPDVGRDTYALTAKGEALLPVLVALMQWGDTYAFGGRGPLQILDAHERKPIRRIAVESESRQTLGLRDLRFKPGPAANEETLERFRIARERAAKS